MENSTLMQQLFQDYLQNGGQPKITSFRLHLEKLMKTEIKPLCGGSRRLAPGAHDWRNELKEFIQAYKESKKYLEKYL